MATIEILFVIGCIASSIVIAAGLTVLIHRVGKKRAIKKSKKISSMLEKVHDEIKEDAEQKFFDLFELEQNNHAAMYIKRSDDARQYDANIREQIMSNNSYKLLQEHLESMKSEIEKEETDEVK